MAEVSPGLWLSPKAPSGGDSWAQRVPAGGGHVQKSSAFPLTPALCPLELRVDPGTFPGPGQQRDGHCPCLWRAVPQPPSPGRLQGRWLGVEESLRPFSAQMCFTKAAFIYFFFPLSIFK